MFLDSYQQDKNQLQSLTMTSSQAIAALYLAQLTASSRRVVASRLDSCAKALGLTKWEEIDWTLIDRPSLLIIKEKLKHLSPATLNAYYSAIKGVMLVAYENGIIDHTQYMRVKNTKPIKGERINKKQMLSGEDIKKLLSSNFSVRDKAIVAVLTFCGLRRSELVEIQWDDINWAEQSILIHGKGNRERKAFFNEFTRNCLEALYKESSNSYCFVNTQYNEKLTDQAIYYILNELQGRAGIEKFSPHNLRRHYVSKLLELGNDLSIVSSMAGHAQISTTQRYDVRGDEHKRKAALEMVI